MSITEIKDIKKLQSMLKSALDELKYIKKCCENAGLELAKHSYAYDYKEKNLVIQAIELNEKYEKLKKTLEEIEKEVHDEMCDTLGHLCAYCDGKYSCITLKILDIINKVKEEE